MNILSITVLAFVLYKLINLSQRLEQGIRVLFIILVGMIIWLLFGRYILPIAVFIVGLGLFGLVVAFIYGAATTIYEELIKNE